MPVAAVPEFLAAVDERVTAAYPDLEVVWFGHIGDGNLHLNILKPDEVSQEAFYERCHRVSPEIFAAVKALGGAFLRSMGWAC